MSKSSKARKSTQPTSTQRLLIVTESDSQHLLTIFPQEVWSFILEYTDAACFKKICSSSPHFENLFQEKRVRILFPAIVNILAKVFHEWVSAWEPYDGDGSDADFKRWYTQYYSPVDLVPARRVCRHWRKGVDHALQNLAMEYKFYDEHKSFNLVTLNQVFTPRFIDLEDFLFDSTYLSTGANPFPIRKVELQLYLLKPEVLLPYYAQCLDMLRDFGKHIWYLQIHLAIIKFRDQMTFFQQLGEMLKLVPNLKVFRICMIRDKLSEEQIHEMKQTFSNFFPALPHLTSIDESGIPFPVLCELVRPNAVRINQVRVELTTFHDFWTFCGMGPRWNLRLRKANMGLSDLTCPWEDIFDEIDRGFGTTLVELSVHLRSPLDYPDNSYKMKLKNLKKFHITMNTAVPLDFLLGVADHLEILGVRTQLNATERNEATKIERDIKFYEHSEKLNESNVWNKFPKLKEVTVWPSFPDGETDVFSCCTRDQWKFRTSTTIPE